MNPISLFDLHRQIRRVIALNFDESLYISAEIVKITCARGHWYIELAEKAADKNQIKAKSTAIIWRNVYDSLKTQHGTVLKQLLQAGVEIAFKAEVQYHEVYGLKLHILSIDPTYTFGKESQRRLEIIDELKRRKVLDLNAQVKTPSILQNIAVISSSNAAGYADFIESLRNPGSKIAYRYTLFQASMQGEKTEFEVRKQLQRIQRRSTTYDLVVIIRGGGGRMDLRFFDHLDLALDIASSSLPIWVGIGHATDQSVIDLVAHTSFKTPTAVAQGIEEHNRSFMDNLQKKKLNLLEHARNRIKTSRTNHLQITKELSFLYRSALDKKNNTLQQRKDKLYHRATTLITGMRSNLNQFKQRIDDLHPAKVLARGYAAIEQDETRIYKKSDLNTSQSFFIKFKDGTRKINLKKK